MKSNKFALFSVVTVVILLLAIFAVKQENETVRDDEVGTSLFPNFKAQVNSVNQIVILEAGKEISVKFTDNLWRVVDKDNYPADVSKIKQVVLKVAGMTTLEAKTKKPENYAKLGLEDPADTKAKSKQLTFKDKDGKALATVILGKQLSSSTTDGGGEALYVRKADDAQAWLVKSEIHVDADAKDWLDSELFSIPLDRIQKVVANTTAKAPLTIAKEKLGDKDFVLEDLPKQKKIASQTELNSIGEGIANIIIKDVLSESNPTAVVFDKDVIHTDFYTFDGLVVSVDTLKQDNKYFAKFSAKYDASIRKEMPPETKTTDDKAAAPAIPAHAAVQPKLKDAEATQAEAEALGKIFKSWIFVISNTKAEKMRKLIDDVVEDVKKKG